VETWRNSSLFLFKKMLDYYINTMIKLINSNYTGSDFMQCKNIQITNTSRGQQITCNFRHNRYHLSIMQIPTYDKRSGQILYQIITKYKNLDTGEQKQDASKILLVNPLEYTINDQYPILYADYIKNMKLSNITKKHSQKAIIKQDNQAKYIYIGTTDETDTCQCCGKNNLKKVVVLMNVNTRDFIFVGSECQYKYLNR